jgi:hypothetical protein
VVQDFGTSEGRFVEHLPTGLALRFGQGAGGATASELIINLDVFEMLVRLNEGYRPSVEEMQGFYLCLGVFKNSLNAQPYREILLTTTGHDFYRLARHDDGRVEMRLMQEMTGEEAAGGAGELMALQKKDREFRLPKISYLDFKTIEMDRVLTGLFERLEHGGYPSVFRDKRELTVDKFVDDILEASHKFIGFAQHREIVERWVETHLMDIVNRGKKNAGRSRAASAARLHLSVSQPQAFAGLRCVSASVPDAAPRTAPVRPQGHRASQVVLFRRFRQGHARAERQGR